MIADTSLIDGDALIAKAHDETVEFYKTHDVDSITDVFEGKTFWRKD